MSFIIYEQLLITMRKKYTGCVYTLPFKKYVCNFLLSMQLCFDEIDGKIHHAIIWATNEALALLRYNSPTFIDMTFKTALRPFL
ncbi:hypothetical protein HZS_5832 [Henneguya salminicola]|nr:hypothetical protein HZS_5832 [Henneguya salminicola]